MLKLVFALISNLAAILLSEYFVSGFHVTHAWLEFGIVTLLFTLANSLILPILRFVFKPFIWLTLGLLAVAMNGALIYAVDIFSDSITINGLTSLVFATLIIGMVNATFAFLIKSITN